MSNFGGDDPELTKRAEYALQKIREFAPASADYLIAQAYYTYYVLRDYERALMLIAQAEEKIPSDARLAALKAWIYRRKGDFESMAESLRQARSTDPRSPGWTIMLTRALLASHRYEDARLEVENSSFDNDWIASLGNLFRLRGHGHFDRWAEAEAEIHYEFEDDADPQDMWGMHIANRDFVAAEVLLNDFPEAEFNLSALDPFSNKLSAQAINYWFLGHGEKLTEILSQLRTITDEAQSSDAGPSHYRSNLIRALIAAVEGNTEQTERFVRRWRRGAAEDLAELTNNRHLSCRALGMSGATRAAADCIRAGVEQPSFVMPFMEPFMPYYDGIRKHSEFVDMLAEINGMANNP